MATSKKTKYIVDSVVIRLARKLSRSLSNVATKLDVHAMTLEAAAHTTARQMASKRMLAVVNEAEVIRAKLQAATKDVTAARTQFAAESRAIDEAFGTSNY